MDGLKDLRDQIDKIDQDILDLLKARFDVTEMMGHIKHVQHLDSYDPVREKKIDAHYREFAQKHGLSQQLVAGLFQSVRAEVKKRHEQIKNG